MLMEAGEVWRSSDYDSCLISLSFSKTWLGPSLIVGVYSVVHTVCNMEGSCGQPHLITGQHVLLFPVIRFLCVCSVWNQIICPPEICGQKYPVVAEPEASSVTDCSSISSKGVPAVTAFI